MSWTTKAVNATASVDATPHPAYDEDLEQEGNVVLRRPPFTKKALDQRAKLQLWVEQKELEKQKNSLGKKHMSTSSRRGKENSRFVTTVSR